MTTLSTPTTRVGAIDEALSRAYGDPPARTPRDPLDQLIETILSQHTSDLNSGRAFVQLKRAFPTWEEAMAAEEAMVAQAIRSAGLANVKSKRIQQVLAQVWEERGSFDLSLLETLPLADAKAWLTALPGVGPKTAACVLMFALSRPALPVDTHVHRVSLRLGLVPDRASAARAHEILEAIVPPDRVYPFHMNAIAHGRQCCRAQHPRCPTCPVRALCPNPEPSA